MSKLNLDQQCARFGHDMCQAVSGVYQGKEKKTKTENLITKSLGVLQEDGVYAFFLYQRSRSKSEIEGARKLEAQAVALLKAVPIKPFDTVTDPLQAVRGDKTTKGLADDLDNLLLAKRLLEQTLIYARYHAKALEG